MTGPIREQVKTDNDRSPTNIEQSDTNTIEIIDDGIRNADERAETSTNEPHELLHSMRLISFYICRALFTD